MSDTASPIFRGQLRGNWVRLRTITTVRWIAIFGQAAAIAVAVLRYDLQIELGLCYLIIGLSVIGNLVATFVLPENKRLAETENLFVFLFDLLQLAALLFVTGGLHNPFAMLLLGPVTVSSSSLSLRSTLILGATAIACATVLLDYHLVLRDSRGWVVVVPDILRFGTWTAIVIGVVFISIYTRRVTQELNSMSDALTATQMALSREQKLTDLGGVVAAAAHELGTPLATIKLTSAELMEDLEDHPELQADAALIREQADRCRDILRSMGRAGKDDLHMRQAPLTTVIHDAAEPHGNRGITLHFEERPAQEGLKQPEILRRPEVIHGIRNLVQNAVDFASRQIWIEIGWSETRITLRIVDDGPGYPASVIGRIGDPFMRRRRAEQDVSKRPGYEGMGLGLFIAKTLLERSGAELSFANGRDDASGNAPMANKSGAIVDVSWPREVIEAPHDPDHGLGENQPFDL
jgi:two-component system sensor histidine kinase RegB